MREFASSARKLLKTKPDALVFSMERGVPGTIYRAGDGVHKMASIEIPKFR